MRAGIALGSNLGDRQHNLSLAREKIIALKNAREPFRCSALYQTDPVNCEPGAQKFLNAVMEIGYVANPLDLLGELQTIEQMLGREWPHTRNISRTIDLDLLYLGDRTMNDPTLKLPHPRIHLRRFVLEPLVDIRPELILPGQTNSVRELLGHFPQDSAVVRLQDEW